MTTEGRPLPDCYPRISKFLLSACAACVAELVTFPLDLTKTRLQIQGEAAQKSHGEVGMAAPYRGMVRTAVGIVQEEGLLKLWQGATPALYRHIVYSGVRMVAYEQLRDSPLGKGDAETFPLWKAVVGGMTAGAVGQFFASPTDLVKVQMQMEGKRRLEGKPPRSDNLRYSKTIACATAFPGLVAATLGTPADVIKTRIMNQPRDKHGRGTLYKSSADCFIQAVRGEGFLSLYKGFIPTWMRMAPWSLVFWLTYEQIRRIVGSASICLSDSGHPLYNQGGGVATEKSAEFCGEGTTRARAAQLSVRVLQLVGEMQELCNPLGTTDEE